MRAATRRRLTGCAWVGGTCPRAAREWVAAFSQASLCEEIGDESVAFSAQTSEGISLFGVGWRHENVVAMCMEGGFGTADADMAVDLAKKQQERIENELG